MNQRKHNRQAILRHRRRGTTPTLVMTTGTGVQVQVTRSPMSDRRASYRTRHAQVFGVWPPTPKIMREIQRWS